MFQNIFFEFSYSKEKEYLRKLEKRKNMKKKFFAYMITGILMFTFLAQGKGTKTYWFQIASQGEGESGFLTNSNLNQKKVYLTFDDGPSDHTAQILDILKKHKVKATFFVVGKETEHAKKMYQRIVLEGHTLAMHSYSHNYDQIYANVGAFSKDLMKLQKYLYDVTDVKPYIYRFPGGSSNHCAKNIKPYIRYVNKKGLLYFDWNALNEDAVNFEQSPQQLNKKILKDVRRQKTSIVLMHDLHETINTVKALDPLIKTLKKEGYQLLPITKNTKPLHHVSIDK